MLALPSGGRMRNVVDVMTELAERGLFRARDLNRAGFSRAWLDELGDLAGAKKLARGVWSHVRYAPTRYELLQQRVPGGVFWGPSALWLQGFLDEEPSWLWLAIDDHAHFPRRLGERTCVLRSRRHAASLLTILPLRTALELRVHEVQRAHRDATRRRRLTRLRDVERLELTRSLSALRVTPLTPAELAQRERPRPRMPLERRRPYTTEEWLETLRSLDEVSPGDSPPREK